MAVRSKLAGVVTSSLLALALGFAVSQCGTVSNASIETYITTSNRGDLATFLFYADILNITWNVTNPGTGTLKKTLTASASCAATDATYGSRACTVTSSACIDGTDVCAASDPPAIGAVFKTTQAPGIGLMVLSPASDQLFVGITAGTCTASITGKYLGMNLGVNQPNVFTLFQPDGAFTSIAKADFRLTGAAGVVSPEFNFDGTGSSPHTSVLSETTCAGGVRSFSIGGTQYSATLAQNGMFLIDAPAGQGGILAFDLATAATLSDIAGKTLRGFTFPDDSPPNRLSVTTGSVNGTSDVLSISSISFDAAASPATMPTLRKVTATGNPFTNESSPPTTYSTGAAYSANSFAATYASVAAIPGLFFIPPTAPDTAIVLLGAMKQTGKVLLFGVTINDRTAAPAGYSNYAPGVAFPNTGAFIAFEQ